jgi:hydroxymethylpyrimidine/phosphomethylpyrimidine kinase
MGSTNNVSRLLTEAGSDSGGGAGIQADLKTFQALGAYGMSALTALTAQNTQGVKAVFPVSETFLVQQIGAVIDDIGVDAVKTGMLFSAPLIEKVSEVLSHYRVKNLVVDPVMVAKGGAKLLEDSAIASLRRSLLPLATVVTPNIPEAEVLTGKPIQNYHQMETAALTLLSLSPNVLIKGGHLESGEIARDLLATSDGKQTWLERPRVLTANTHGTGCTYSAAIAVFLGQGHSLEESVRLARDYVQGALLGAATRKIGHGCGPLDHSWNLRRGL